VNCHQFVHNGVLTSRHEVAIKFLRQIMVQNVREKLLKVWSELSYLRRCTQLMTRSTEAGRRSDSMASTSSP
jgi:hypothetical protein